ncbi:MAG: hypothetical protein RIF39_04335 [Cyclobacteriaceae bacterium]
MADLEKPSNREKLINFLLGAGKIALGVGVVALIVYIIAITTTSKNEETNEATILYIASFVILLLISTIATFQIRDIIRSRKNNINLQRSNYIAVMIGLVITIILFKQPFLDRIFAEYTTNSILETLLFGTSTATGWLVWYLNQMKKYGEFFNVFLLTVIVGFCWYARLTGPEEVQITAAGFLLGSLFRIAKKYIDEGTAD